MPELEHKVRHAIHLGNYHRSGSCSLRRSRSWRVNTANAISDISFMPGNDDRLLLTASKGIWCQISCWDMNPQGHGLESEPRKVCDWGPKSTVFLGFAVNSDPTSPVQLAVGITRNEFVIFRIIRQHLTWLSASAASTCYLYLTLLHPKIPNSAFENLSPAGFDR